MALTDYAKYDGLGLAKLVKDRKVRPIELVDAAIARIEKHNPTLNAVVWTMFERAREMARKKLPDGPFRG
ncbi:MAG: amidase, partial [bacterium]